ncbi:MAG: hypothetical protein K2P94_07810 [Rhodospirillaceae bacterium]|nr:hypothetical protein [Rhodospirillaceae bacterium]
MNYVKKGFLPAVGFALALATPAAIAAEGAAPAPAAAPPAAQQMTPANVRGTIASLDNGVMVLKARDGSTINVQLGEKTGVNTLSKAGLADIKADSFVGVTATTKGEDMHAVEVHIFPDAMRGAGEGHRPWDLMPGSTMTNANITETVAKNDGKTLTLKYKDGEKKISVGPDTAVVTVAPGTKDDLKVGAKVFTIAMKAADGSIRGVAVLVGKDGITPPM